MKLLLLAALLCISLFAQNTADIEYDGENYKITKNIAQIHTLREDCDKGIMKACNNVGIAYSKGYGVKRDQRVASKYFAESCVGNYMNGCYHLGMARKNGHGVKKHSSKAQDLFKKACEGGNKNACIELK
jgi:TPR repeat protein